MRNLIMLLPIVILISCFASGLKGGPVIEMDCSRRDLINGLSEFLKNNNQYALPKSKEKINIWSKEDNELFLGANYVLDTDIVYVGLVRGEYTDSMNSAPSYINIKYIYSNKMRLWRRVDKFDDDFVLNLTKKFEERILKKLPSQGCDCNILRFDVPW